MSLWEQTSQVIRTLWAPVYVGVGGVVLWVWTQDRRLRELEREFEEVKRDMLQDREAAQRSRDKIEAAIEAGFGDIKTDVRDLRNWVMTDHRSGKGD